MNNLVIYGGTFDPPHNGHLKTAVAVQAQFHFERFIVLPCKTPLLKKEASASSEQRLHMLQLAFQNRPEFSTDDREITRDTPSYMVETLKSFRKELGDSVSITLCLGMDAFMQLPKWHSWRDLITLSNLLVLKRAEIEENCLGSLESLLKNHEVFDKKYILDQAHGAIYRFDAGQYPISSSWLRQQLEEGKDIKPYVPLPVYEYIKSQALYRLYPGS